MNSFHCLCKKNALWLTLADHMPRQAFFAESAVIVQGEPIQPWRRMTWRLTWMRSSSRKSLVTATNMQAVLQIVQDSLVKFSVSYVMFMIQESQFKPSRTSASIKIILWTSSNSLLLLLLHHTLQLTTCKSSPVQSSRYLYF